MLPRAIPSYSTVDIGVLQTMDDQEKQKDDLRDKNEAAEERPVPSQAEGDLETVEEDLKQKEKRDEQGSRSSGKQG